MKFIMRVAVLLIICLFIGYNTDLFFSKSVEKNTAEDTATKSNFPDNKKTTNENPKQVEDSSSLARFINKNINEVTKEFGDPVRVDKSAYGYDNYIYNQPGTSYMQVGVADNTVQTIYALGQDLNVMPYTIGMSAEKVFTDANLQSEISFNYKDSYYKFELSEEDLNARPIVNIGSGVYAQLNFDKFKAKLVSVRYLNKLSFIKMRPYELSYQGEIYEEKLSPEDWNKIDDASSKQVLEITNVIRDRYGVEEVAWDEEVAKVAYGHSVDMKENDYFDHNSPTNGDLSNRLKAGNVKYTKAGENIAFNYVDSAAAVEGWLNSKGHRDNLLDGTYTYMGAGTYQKYYTQNFIIK
ncbi:CAP domain-containing protein [Listeria seeligeri]|uniref:CAP domain-containing protein n=1 Tax=Listeria seeligeri TaxID=1640 RepID=UPI0010D369AE|nr:CAP domain-containing protein [Listeria seeligeri]MBC1423174.1 CAP domain-containing protein [Listeria seeligeri]MBC1480692.1 CAP domain-containing protein [Listeria seeligeri]MBC1526076.1 CAP domain-containing protein [Listeria seeligeri]MBC1531808.1 CAP domain-containing protein [Listeria seeligeri]MBC1719632.1 CAP domain-containing protein [Listeria seeligeri]